MTDKRQQMSLATAISKAKWLDVKSSNIKRVGWIRKPKGMLVEFHESGVYFYFDVPYQRAVAMCRAESVGRYLHTRIIPSYTYIKLTDKPINA